MIFAVLAENFTREKIGNAKASSRDTFGSAVILNITKTTQKVSVANELTYFYNRAKELGL